LSYFWFSWTQRTFSTLISLVQDFEQSKKTMIGDLASSSNAAASVAVLSDSESHHPVPAAAASKGRSRKPVLPHRHTAPPVASLPVSADIALSLARLVFGAGTAAGGPLEHRLSIAAGRHHQRLPALAARRDPRRLQREHQHQRPSRHCVRSRLTGGGLLRVVA
jgi:hypothetical protein